MSILASTSSQSVEIKHVMNYSDFCVDCLNKINTKKVDELVGPTLLALKCIKCSPKVHVATKGFPQFAVPKSFLDVNLSVPLHLKCSLNHNQVLKTYNGLADVFFSSDSCEKCEEVVRAYHRFPLSMPVLPKLPSEEVPVGPDFVYDWKLLKNDKRHTLTCFSCHGLCLENFHTYRNGRTRVMCLKCFDSKRKNIMLSWTSYCHKCNRGKQQIKKLFCDDCTGPNGIREEYYEHYFDFVAQFERGESNAKLSWIMQNCDSSPLFWSNNYPRRCQNNPESLYMAANTDALASQWIQTFRHYFDHFLYKYNPTMKSNLAKCVGKSMASVMTQHPHYLLRLYEEDTFPSEASRIWVRMNLSKIKALAATTPKPTKKIIATKEKPLKPVKAPKPPKVKPIKPPKVKKDSDAKYQDPARMEVGRFAGRKMAFVADKHTVYLLRQHRLGRLTPMENEWLENNKDQILSTLNFPDHTVNHYGTNMTMEQILQEDPSYLIYVAEKMHYNTKARKWVEANWNRMLQALEETGVDLESMGVHEL